MARLRNPSATRWDPDRAFEDAGWDSPFPRGITFADVDFEIEINGHFLVIEGKREGEALSNGQRWTNTRRVQDGRDVLVVRGTPPDVVTELWWFGVAQPRTATLADLWVFCHEWATWADTAPRPEQRHSDFAKRQAAA